MNLLPQASGTRPRAACEISAQAVVGARSADAASPLAAIARVPLAEGAIAAGLKPGNVVDRVAVIAALKSVLETLDVRAADLTLVIPDAAVRVLLLDFDSLSAKPAEALPIVRFRLKKLLPFDADEAMVSYQVMSSSKQMVRVLAVAIPQDVLAEYETAAREAGFEPGAVLPSTLAALAAIEGDEPALLVNANPLSVTTAIVRSGMLLLHRSLDFQAQTTQAATLPEIPLTLVDEQATLGEWAAQEPLPEHGRNPYADRAADESAVQGFNGITAIAEPPTAVPPAPPLSLAGEIAQAVSVAAAYFEDTLSTAPTRVLSAGPLGAERLGQILASEGVGGEHGIPVRELVDSSALLAEAVSTAVPRSNLSSVVGALRG
jgi:type IV pilus assembly protein PilM